VACFFSIIKTIIFPSEFTEGTPTDRATAEKLQTSWVVEPKNQNIRSIYKAANNECPSGPLFPAPRKGALEASEGVWHIVNAHSTLCHFVLMACLPHSFYIKPPRDSAFMWAGGGSQPLASNFGFNFLFFPVLVGVNKSLNKKLTMQLKATPGIKKVGKFNQILVWKMLITKYNLRVSFL